MYMKLTIHHSLLSLPDLASLSNLKEHTRSCYLNSASSKFFSSYHFSQKPTKITASLRANHKPLLMRSKTTNNPCYACELLRNSDDILNMSVWP